MSSGTDRSLLGRVVALGAGSSTALIGTFVSSLALIAMIGPGPFGRFGTALAAATVLEICLTGGREQLFPVLEADAVPGYYSATVRATIGRLAGAAFGALMVWAFGVFAPDLLIATLLIGAGKAAFNIGVYSLLARGETKTLAVRKAQSGAAMGVGLVAAAAISPNLIWLALAYTASRALLGWPVWEWVGATPAVAVEDRRASYHVFAGQMASNLALQAPVFMSGGFFGPVTTGYFVFGRRMIGQPTQLLTQSVSEALLGTSSRLAATPVKRLASRVLVLSLGSALVVAGVARWLTEILGGYAPEAWAGSVAFLAPISVMAVCQVFTSPFATVLAIKRMERQRNIWLWCRLAILVVVGYLFRNLSAEDFFWRIAIASVATYALLPIYVLVVDPAKRAESVEEAPKVWFVAGYGRSGSTVTASWLASWLEHRDGRPVRSLGELGPWLRSGPRPSRAQLTCTCGAPVDQCQQWNDIEEFDRFDPATARVERILSGWVGTLIPLSVLASVIRRRSLFDVERGQAVDQTVLVDASKTVPSNANAPRIWAALGCEVTVVTVSRPIEAVLNSRRSAFARQDRNPPPLWKARTLVGQRLATWFGHHSARRLGGVRADYDQRPSFAVFIRAVGAKTEEVELPPPPAHMAGDNRMRYAP